MEWTKVSVETTGGTGVETVTGILMSCGITGVEIIDHHERVKHFADTARTWDYADESLLEISMDGAYVVFYVPKTDEGHKLFLQIKHSLESFDPQGLDIGSLTIRVEETNDETWLHEWKKHFKPLHLGKVVVVPEWENYSPTPEETIFKIDPGSAFGTGQHQTTQLCIHALQKWISPEDIVLDIGCGSGILSIISLLLGAKDVCAIDIDPAGAIAATKKNAELNPIDTSKIKILAGDVLSEVDTRAEVGLGKYNLIVANIVADVIIPLAKIAREFAIPQGLFITSGIIAERLPEVITAFENAGITVLDQTEIEGWHCVVGRF